MSCSKDYLFVLVGNEPVLGGAFCYFFVFFLICLSHLRGNTTLVCSHLGSGSGYCVPHFGLPLPFVIFFGAVASHIYLPSLLPFYIIFLFVVLYLRCYRADVLPVVFITLAWHRTVYSMYSTTM